MKTLKFAKHLVPLVKEGYKTATWRLFDDKDLQPGDRLGLVDASSLEQFALAEILSVKETQFKHLGPDDFEGHEPCSDPQKLYADYSAYYDRHVDEDTFLKIVKYRVIEQS